MKQIFILIACLMIFISVSAQRCGHDGIGFYSQEQVDNFFNLYPNCREIEGDVIISGSEITNVAKLLGIRSILGNFEISHTEMLGTLEGLDSLKYVGGHLGIYSNLGLWYLTGLGALDTVKDNFEIFANPYLQRIDGLSHLKHIGKNLWIGSNTSLDSLKALNDLETIGGLLQINDNPSLASIRGLRMLRAIGGDLYIFSNPLLTGLQGLDSINAGTIFNVFINSNHKLSSCAVQSICRYFSIPWANSMISNNAIGCNNSAEVKGYCDTLSVQDPPSADLFSVYPNPSTGMASVEIDQRYIPGTLSVLNLQGEVLLSGTLKSSISMIDVNALPKGLFMLRFVGRNRTWVKRFIIQ